MSLFILQEAPLLVVGLWPGEGIPVFTATGIPLEVRAGPAHTSDLVRHTDLPAGANISYDATEFQTVKAGQLVARRAARLVGTNFGPIRRLTRDRYYGSRPPRSEIALQAGDTVDYLQPRAEGSCFLAVERVVWEVDWCPTFDEAGFTVISDPALEWWIGLTEHGVRVGWVVVTEDGMSIGRLPGLGPS